MQHKEENMTSQQFIFICVVLSIHICRFFPFILNAQIEPILEDGFIFLQQSYEYGLKSLLISHQGYLHTWLRIIAFFASVLLPLDLVPYAYALGTFLTMLMPLYLLFSNRSDAITGTNGQTKFLIALVYVTLPAANETYGNLTNLQWFMPVWVVLWLFSESSPKPIIRYAECLWLLICCLTGPYVLFYLLLIFFFRKEIKVIPKKHTYLILFIGALIQTGYIFFTRHEISSGSKEIIHLSKLLGGIAAHLFWNSLTGFFSIKFIGRITQMPVYYLFGLTGYAWVFYKTFKQGNKPLVFLHLFGLLCILGGLAKNPEQTAESFGGLRYYTAGIAATLFSIAFLINSEVGKSKYVFTGMITCSLLLAIPLDFRITRARNSEWHKEVLTHYYNAREGEIVTLPKSTVTIRRKASSVKPISTWQKFLLKKEALWTSQNDRAESVFLPDTVADNKILTKHIETGYTFDASFFIPSDSIEKVNLVFMTDGIWYTYETIPYPEAGGYGYYVTGTTRDLSHDKVYKIGVYSNKRKMMLLKTTFSSIP